MHVPDALDPVPRALLTLLLAPLSPSQIGGPAPSATTYEPESDSTWWSF